MNRILSFNKICLICFSYVILISCRDTNFKGGVTLQVPVTIMEMYDETWVGLRHVELTVFKRDSLLIHCFDSTKLQDGHQCDGSSIMINPSDTVYVIINSRKSFLVNSGEIKGYQIRKYLYDIPEVSDEEAFYYITEGLLICSEPRYSNRYTLFKYSEIDVMSLMKIIRKNGL